jgi:hypothetical protein
MRTAEALECVCERRVFVQSAYQIRSVEKRSAPANRPGMHRNYRAPFALMKPAAIERIETSCARNRAAGALFLRGLTRLHSAIGNI